MGVCAADSVVKQREARRRQDLHVVASIVEADEHRKSMGYKEKKPPCPARPTIKETSYREREREREGYIRIYQKNTHETKKIYKANMFFHTSR